MGNCVFCGAETNYILYEGKYVCEACAYAISRSED